MYIALWGLGRGDWPVSVTSTGGKFLWEDDQETPNTQQTTFHFGDAQLTFDARNLPTQPENLGGVIKPNYVGTIFYGEVGFLCLNNEGIQVNRSKAGSVSGDAARGAGAGGREQYEKTLEEKPSPGDTQPHMKNFLDAVRSRDSQSLHAEIAIGARAAAFCHLANIAYRVGRTLRVDRSRGRFLGDDEANALLSRDYRAPYVVPEAV
jgi:hypothetical protein